MPDIHQNINGAAQVMGTGSGATKHAFITSTGIMFCTQKDNAGGIAFYRSMDNGTTWVSVGSYGSGICTSGSEYSVFCDEKDNVHLVLAKHLGGTNDGRTYAAVITYVHTYVTAAGALAAWSGEVALSGYDYWHCPDVVAHEHNGQIRAHIMFNYNWSGDNRHITAYARVLTNNQDNVNHVVEQGATYVHDVVGGATQPGKVSVELRHNGNGKTPQTLADGYRYPDILYTFTSSGVLHYGRVRWNGGNSWAAAELVVIDGTWGNQVSSSTFANSGGLWEHHRWAKTLYSAKDNQVVIVGWLSTAGHAQQALILYEYPIGGTTRNVSTALVDWPTSTPYGLLSGSATLDPDGNIFAFGNVHWYGGFGYCRVLRPKGSLARTFAQHTTIDTVLTTPEGARAYVLPYPQGEQHVFYSRADNVLVHWRTNLTCAYQAISGAWARRPRFLAKAGRWVPIQSKPL